MPASAPVRRRRGAAPRPTRLPDAALLAHAVPGRPVKLQYTREQEHRWEPYGSAMVIDIEAGVNEQGDVLDWDLASTTTTKGDIFNSLFTFN